MVLISVLISSLNVTGITLFSLQTVVINENLYCYCQLGVELTEFILKRIIITDMALVLRRIIDDVFCIIA